MKNRLWIIFAVGTFLGLNGTFVHAHPRFDVIDLGPITTSVDSGGFQPTLQYISLNNTGQITGFRLPNYDVFLWQNGQVTDLGIQGIPVKINDSGQVVVNSNPERKVYFWENGTVTDLSATIGAGTLTALDFNNAGQVLLSHNSSSNARISYKIWKNGTITDLENPPDGLRPYHLNNLGEVICLNTRSPASQGWVFFKPVTQVPLFLWKDNEQRQVDVIKTSTSGTPLGINDAGQVIFDDLLWQDGQTLPLDFRPILLTNNGQIFGTVKTIWESPGYYSEITPFPSFVLWEDGVVRPVVELIDNSTFFEVGGFMDANDNGQILTSGSIVQTQTTKSPPTFSRHALILTPNGQTDTNDPPAQGCGQYLPFLIGLLVLGVKGLGLIPAVRLF